MPPTADSQINTHLQYNLHILRLKSEKENKPTCLRHEMLVVVLLVPAGGNCQVASTKSHGGIFLFFKYTILILRSPWSFLLILHYFRSGCKRLSIIIWHQLLAAHSVWPKRHRFESCVVFVFHSETNKIYDLWLTSGIIRCHTCSYCINLTWTFMWGKSEK